VALFHTSCFHELYAPSLMRLAWPAINLLYL